MTQDAKADVIGIHGAGIPPDQVLRYAQAADLENVVVIGWTREPDEKGEKFYLASSAELTEDETPPRTDFVDMVR